MQVNDAPLWAPGGASGRVQRELFVQESGFIWQQSCPAEPVLMLTGVPQGTLTTSMGTGSLRARMAPAPRSTLATSLTTLTTSAAPSSTAWTRNCSKTTSSGRCKCHLLSERDLWAGCSQTPSLETTWLIPWVALEPGC